MKTLARAAIGLFIVTAAAGGAPAAAQTPGPRPVLNLPVTGTFARGGEFKGTISINRFAQRGNDIVAIGFVTGVLSRGGGAIGTAVAGEVSWTVRVSSGGLTTASDRVPAPAAPAGRVIRAAWLSSGSAEPTFLRVQDTCPVLNISLGPQNVNLLGFEVALGAVTLDLTGVAGTPLGDLVCAASDLLGQVAAVVELLNSVLGLVTGLLGGLLGGLGGLGGGVPPIQ